MSIATILVCDRCLRPYAGSRHDMVDDRNVWNRGTERAPAHVLRTEAKPEGWSVGVRAWTKRTQQGAMDFCPTCVEEACVGVRFDEVTHD